MKRLLSICLLLVALCSVGELRAQSSEFRLGYGFFSSNSLVGNYSDVLKDIVDGKDLLSANEHTIGSVYLSYRFKVLPKIQIGATLGYEQVEKEYGLDAGNMKVGKNNYYTAALDFQFRYLTIPSEVLTLYWSASAGLTTHNQKIPEVESYGKERELFFAYQVSPIGLTVGLPNFGAFAEVGFGYKGILQLGLYARF